MGFSMLITRAFKRGEPHDVKVWLEMANSYSGYERQAAVEALARLRCAPALPSLLIRANDWVPQVRLAAQQALLSLLDDAFIAEWIQALEAVVALGRAKRADHQALMDAIGDYLSRPAHFVTVVAASVQASVFVKRFAFDLQCAQVRNDQTLFELLAKSLTGDDVVIAQRAIERSGDIAQSEHRRLLAVSACNSCFASVRAQGLRMALAGSKDVASDFLQAMCLDDSALVRSLALGALQIKNQEAVQMGVIKARQLFECSESSAKKRTTALLFLCSADPAAALEHCERARRSSLPALRRIAYARLLTGSPVESREGLLLSALADSSPKVQRLAVEHVRRGASPPPGQRVLDIALGHKTPDALARAFSILRHSPTWGRLHWLLQVRELKLTADCEQVILSALSMWSSDAVRSFMLPSAAERISLRDEWNKSAPTIPKSLQERINFHLKAYQILP